MYNGATLSAEVPVEKFSQPHQSKPYNPIMAMVFYKCGFIENWGKGTLNMIDECLKYRLPKPTFEYEWNSLKTTFYANKKVGEGITGGLSGMINGGLSGMINGGLSGTIKEIYDYIKSHEGTSAVDMENKLNIPLRTLQRWLKELKEKDLIEYRGSKKNGGYFVKSMEVKQ